MGQPGATATSTAAFVVAPRRRARSRRRRDATAPGSYGQLPDARTTGPGQVIAEPKSWKLPELIGSRRACRRRPFPTTKRRLRHNSTGEAQAAIVGIREINEPGAKHIIGGIRATSKRLLRTTCTRWPATLPRRAQLLS